MLKSLQQEYHYLNYLRHHNVLGLYGVCRDGIASSLLVLEFADMGSLHQVPSKYTGVGLLPEFWFWSVQV